MSRPRFLADQDVDNRIVRGVVRNEPLVDFQRLLEVGLSFAADRDVLEYAAAKGQILVSHDRNTMISAAEDRMRQGRHMPGLLIAPQGKKLAAVIDSLVLIWSASESEEWSGRIEFLPL